MLKDKDTSMSGKLGIDFHEDLNTTEKADSKITIIGRKVVKIICPSTLPMKTRG